MYYNVSYNAYTLCHILMSRGCLVTRSLPLPGGELQIPAHGDLPGFAYSGCCVCVILCC